ncbi:MAG: hypothetical protein ABI725_05435 [Chloroflexota bacterium]
MAQFSLGLLVAIMLMFLSVTSVLAHPLGNTSVNLYERIEIDAQEISVKFILDVSEIPALRERSFSDTNDDGLVDNEEATAYLDGFWGYLEPLLQLSADGRPAQLHRVGQELTFPLGQGGLLLMRVVFELRAAQPAQTTGAIVAGTLTETAFQGVPGWHEIIVLGGAGVALLDSSVPDSDVTNELTAYPPDMLTNPLSVREASFQYRVDQPSATPPAATAPPATSGPQPTASGTGLRPLDPMVALLGQRLDLKSSLFGLVLATVLGAVHALTPGHGKTLVAAYLVGSRANIRHGFWLGGTVAVTHTAGIFVLGMATLAFTELIVPERIVSWLSVATGLLIAALGAVFVWRAQHLRVDFSPAPAGRAKSSAAARRRSGHRHDSAGGHGHKHDRDIEHDHAHEHSHEHEQDATPQLQRRDVAILGIVGGLVPSGSALILLLSSIALNEVFYGLLLIIAFGLGMAAVLIGITTGIVLMRRTPVIGWERWRDPRLRALALWLPTISGLIVVALGVYLTLDAFRNLR